VAAPAVKVAGGRVVDQVCNSDVNKDLTCKAKAKELSFKAKAKAKDLSFKAKAKAKAKDLSLKAKAKDTKIVLEGSLWTRPRPRTNITGL